MTFDQLVDRLRAQFDAPQYVIEQVVNDRHKRMVADARWTQSQQIMDTTVNGQSTYDLPAGLVHLGDVKVNGTAYDWAAQSDIWNLDSTDSGSWFSVFDDATSTPKLQITPAPDQDGLEITGLAVLAPTDLSYGVGGVFVVPSDLHSYLHAGCKADLYEEFDERPDLAVGQEGRFEAGIVKLRARRHSLVGPRVTRAKIAGRDF